MVVDCKHILPATFRFGVLSAINEDEDEEQEDDEDQDTKAEQTPSREEVDAAIKMVSYLLCKLTCASGQRACAACTDIYGGFKLIVDRVLHEQPVKMKLGAAQHTSFTSTCTAIGIAAVYAGPINHHSKTVLAVRRHCKLRNLSLP